MLCEGSVFCRGISHFAFKDSGEIVYIIESEFQSYFFYEFVGIFEFVFRCFDFLVKNVLAE